MSVVPRRTHPDEPSWSHAVAIVAGGTSGVGLATAQRLLSIGVRRLVVVGRDPGRTAAASAELSRASDAETIPVVADVGDPDQAAHAAAATVQRFGRIDLAVCSTVPSDIAPELLFRTPPEDIERILVELAVPPLQFVRAVLPTMREQRSGSIVTIASDAAKVATPGETVIGAAMAGIVMFTRTAALECKRDGVRINTVTPSLIADTPTGRRMLEGGLSSRIFERAAELASLGVPTADDVSRLVCHLLGPDSAHVTGQAVSINGGISTA